MNRYCSELFWRLDVWEDDSRRRKRFIPNVYGSRHEEAVLLQEERRQGDNEGQDEVSIPKYHHQ